MHGKIHVDSQPERGTRLMLEFEFAVAPEPALPHPARPAFNGARALIADDDRANQMLLKRQLEQHGLTVSCCNNGIQGLRQWAKGKLDIIFCDMHMPELNGAELTRRIRSLERRLNKTPIPIIGVSADLSSPMAGSGVDYCLSKPTSAEDLASLLHQYLDTRPRPGEKKRVRFEVLHQLSQDDVEFERDFLDTVLKNNRDDLQKLRRAHEEQDRAQMAESLHRLKSMLRLLASDAIIKQCQTLEHAVQDQQTKLIDDQLPELEHEIRAMNDELVIYLKR